MRPSGKKADLSPTAFEQEAMASREINPLYAAGANVLTGQTGLMRGTANLLGKPFISEGPPLGERIWPKAPDSEGSAGKIVGSILDPVAWGVGGAVSKVLPYSRVLGQGAVEAAKATARNLAGGAIAGGTIGGLSDEGDAQTGALLGAGMNVVLPPALNAVLKGAAAAKNTIYPSVGSLSVKAAGDKTDDVIQALSNTRSGVPGVNLTAGQASVPANSAEFAALSDLVASRGNPSRYFGPKGIEGQQEAARLASMTGQFGTPADLAAAELARNAASKGNYKTAFEVAVRRNPELRELWKNPYFRDELPEAWKILRSEGLSPKTDLTKLLHYVKLGLDARLESATKPGQPAISEASKHAIGGVKEKLVSWLSSNNAEYELARAAHEAASKPITQMKIGQELEKVMTAPATGAERPSAFGGALRKIQTSIDKHTGKPAIESLTDPQKQALNALLEDFKRDASYQVLAKAGRANLRERVGAEQLPPTGFFQPMVSAARSWVNRLLGTGFEKAINRAAPIFENPQALAQEMRSATPQQRAILGEMLARYVAAAAVSGQTSLSSTGTTNEP